MTAHEALYGRRCRSLFCCDEISERKLLDLSDCRKKSHSLEKD